MKPSQTFFWFHTCIRAKKYIFKDLFLQCLPVPDVMTIITALLTLRTSATKYPHSLEMNSNEKSTDLLNSKLPLIIQHSLKKNYYCNATSSDHKMHSKNIAEKNNANAHFMGMNDNFTYFNSYILHVTCTEINDQTF